jgi:hypothetical protein
MCIGSREIALTLSCFLTTALDEGEAVSFMLRPLYLSGSSPLQSLDGRWDEHQTETDVANCDCNGNPVAQPIANQHPE